MPALPRKSNRFLSSPVTLIVIGLLTVYILFQFFDVYSKKKYTSELLNESRTYHTNIRHSLSEVEERNALIEDERGREAYLREKEGMLLPGEEVYVIVDTPKTGVDVTSEVKKSWLQRIIPFLD